MKQQRPLKFRAWNGKHMIYKIAPLHEKAGYCDGAIYSLLHKPKVNQQKTYNGKNKLTGEPITYTRNKVTVDVIDILGNDVSASKLLIREEN